jgi:hypothetical protein
MQAGETFDYKIVWMFYSVPIELSFHLARNLHLKETVFYYANNTIPGYQPLAIKNYEHHCFQMRGFMEPK